MFSTLGVMLLPRGALRIPRKLTATHTCKLLGLAEEEKNVRDGLQEAAGMERHENVAIRVENITRNSKIVMVGE